MWKIFLYALSPWVELNDFVNQLPTNAPSMEPSNSPTAHPTPSFDYSQVKKFAPVLKFDRAADGYPMSAQAYNDDPKCLQRCSNDKLDTLSNPTYFRVVSDDRKGNMDINYWSFYGRQNGCIDGDDGPGSSDMDWEHAQVHIRAYKLDEVTFHQHGDWYTTTRYRTELNSHPVVYVGKKGHGSYHNTNPDSFQGLIGGGCGHFWDWRNPASESDWLWAMNNLINADSDSEAWLIDDSIDIYGNKPKNVVDVYTGCDGCGCNYKDCESWINMFRPKCIGGC